MKIAVDINIMLDVFQRRTPHYAASAQVASMVVAETFTAVFPSHGLATLYYLVRKYATKADAEAAIE